MNDTISRQAAINAMEKIVRYTDHDEPVIDWNDFVTTIVFLSSTQPEVILCQNCRYYDEHECKHPRGLVFSEVDDFCSYGKRRIDGVDS